jgi:hypothetical protein
MGRTKNQITRKMILRGPRGDLVGFLGGVAAGRRGADVPARRSATKGGRRCPDDPTILLCTPRVSYTPVSVACFAPLGESPARRFAALFCLKFALNAKLTAIF